MIDLIGQRYGKLTVLEATENRFHRSIVWRCQCDCGTECDVPAPYLRRGAVTSCGSSQCKKDNPRKPNKPHKPHKPRKDSNLTGKVFGELTVIEPTEKRLCGGVIIWKCQCSCGKIAYVAANSLKFGRTRSCGHLHAKMMMGNQFAVTKIWTLVDQSGNEFVTKNLSLWAREHTDLFGKHAGDKSAHQIATGFRLIAQTLSGKAKGPLTYMGWTLKCPPQTPPPD